MTDYTQKVNRDADRKGLMWGDYAHDQCACKLSDAFDACDTLEARAEAMSEESMGLQEMLDGARRERDENATEVMRLQDELAVAKETITAVSECGLEWANKCAAATERIVSQIDKF